MGIGMSLAAFADGFAGARERKKDRAEREAMQGMNERMLGIMEKKAAYGDMTAVPMQYGMGALPDQVGGGGDPATVGGDRSAAGASPWKIPTGDIADRIRTGFIDRGMAPHIAEAFVWNGKDESGLRTDINEQKPLVPGSRGGFGIWQHTGPRRRALEAYAASVGKPVGDLDTQMDFVMQELQGSEKGAWNAISSTKTPGEAAAAIVNKFLRPAPEHRQRRESAYLNAMPNTGNAMGALRPVS